MSFLEYVGLGAIVGLCILLASLVIAKCLGAMSGDSYDEEQANRDKEELLNRAHEDVQQRPRVRAIS